MEDIRLTANILVDPRSDWTWNQQTSFDYRNMTSTERTNVFQAIQNQNGDAHPDFPTATSGITLGTHCSRTLPASGDNIVSNCSIGFVRPDSTAGEADMLEVQEVDDGGPNDGLWWVYDVTLLSRTAAGRNPHVDPGSGMTWGPSVGCPFGDNWYQANQCIDSTPAHQQRLDTLLAGVMHHETYGITNKWGHEQLSRDTVLAHDPYPVIEGLVSGSENDVVNWYNAEIFNLNRDTRTSNDTFDNLARQGNLSPANFPSMSFRWFNPADTTFYSATISGGWNHAYRVDDSGRHGYWCPRSSRAAPLHDGYDLGPSLGGPLDRG